MAPPAMEGCASSSGLRFVMDVHVGALQYDSDGPELTGALSVKGSLHCKCVSNLKAITLQSTSMHVQDEAAAR